MMLCEQDKGVMLKLSYHLVVSRFVAWGCCCQAQCVLPKLRSGTSGSGAHLVLPEDRWWVRLLGCDHFADEQIPSVAWSIEYIVCQMGLQPAGRVPSAQCNKASKMRRCSNSCRNFGTSTCFRAILLQCGHVSIVVITVVRGAYQERMSHSTNWCSQGRWVSRTSSRI